MGHLWTYLGTDPPLLQLPIPMATSLECVRRVDAIQDRSHILSRRRIVQQNPVD